MVDASQRFDGQATMITLPFLALDIVVVKLSVYFIKMLLTEARNMSLFFCQSVPHFPAVFPLLDMSPSNDALSVSLV
jgi:hypothetical protein